MKSIKNIGVLGGGNAARALTAYLAQRGHTVWLYARRSEQLQDLKESSHIRAEGLVEGQFPIGGVVDSLKELTEKCDVLFIATVATAYADVASDLAPYLKSSRHYLVLFSGKLFGSLLVERTLAAHGVHEVPVIETDSLFACRTKEDGTIWIRGIKNWTLYSGAQYGQTMEFGGLLKHFFPWLDPADSPIQRGLTDFGAHAHAVITIANLSKIDRGEPFLFYYEGLSSKTVALLEQVEAEFKEVAHAYGVSLIPMKDLLNRYYGCQTDSLLEAMTTVPNYRHSVAPTTLDHRYLREDVACTLVPVCELADKAGLAIPMVRAVLAIATTLTGAAKDPAARTLCKLGMADMKFGDIKAWLSQVQAIPA